MPPYCISLVFLHTKYSWGCLNDSTADGRVDPILQARGQRGPARRARVAPLAARTVLGWPKRCNPWEYSGGGLTLAQLLGQLGVFLTCPRQNSVAGHASPRYFRARTRCRARAV
jgi:hypothetical protein